MAAARLSLPRMLAPLTAGLLASWLQRGSTAVSYLMGLNMAFPKSWNLRTSFRCTPLGFTTRGGDKPLATSPPESLPGTR